MSFSDWVWIIGLAAVLIGPFLVPLVARFVFRHRGVWLYRLASAGRWIVGCLCALLAYMDMQYFANGYGPDTAYHDRVGFISSVLLASIAMFLCWAPWGRWFDKVCKTKNDT